MLKTVILLIQVLPHFDVKRAGLSPHIGSLLEATMSSRVHLELYFLPGHWSHMHCISLTTRLKMGFRLNDHFTYLIIKLSNFVRQEMFLFKEEV